jgi:hypothetical protein
MVAATALTLMAAGGGVVFAVTAAATTDRAPAPAPYDTLALHAVLPDSVSIEAAAPDSLCAYSHRAGVRYRVPAAAAWDDDLGGDDVRLRAALGAHRCWRVGR